MPPGGSMRTQIGELVIATSIVQLANGFFGTFVSLRVAIENFDAAGLVLSAYFAGFTVGALRCGKVISARSPRLPGLSLARLLSCRCWSGRWPGRSCGQ